MPSTVADLTHAELRELIEEVVREQLVELVGDPDQGLELRPRFVRLLEERRAGFESDGKALSIDEAFAAVQDD